MTFQAPPRSVSPTFLCLLAALSLPFTDGSGQVPSQRGKERLVPGNFGEISDAAGHRWSIQQSGVINRGGNSMINTCGQLVMNGVPFYSSSSPMVSSDRKEFVLEHANSQQLGGLKVSRRIRVMHDQACLRFLEVFENPTGQALAVSVELRHKFGTQYKEYFSDGAQRNVNGFGKDESGLLVVPSSSSSNYKPILLTGCSPTASLKPRISNQNQYTIFFHYQITVPAGQTAVVMHSMGQVPKQSGSLSAKEISGLLKDSSLKSLFKSVPEGLRSRIVNFSGGGLFGSLSLLSSTSVDGLGVDRARSDVLAMGETTRMLGTASCAELKFATGYGEALIPFEKVSALVGANHGRRNLSRIFLRDGQVYTGTAAAGDMRFVMADGTRMKLAVSSLDRLLRSESGGEGKWGEAVTAMLETYSGDRIAITDSGGLRLEAVTPWGAIEFGLDDILWLSPPEDGEMGHRIEFKDGSRIFAYLKRMQLPIESEVFGRIEIDSVQLRTVITRGMLAKMDEREKAAGTPVFGDEDQLLVPHLNLVGGQRIIARVAAPTIGAVTNAQLIEIPPENIRLIRSLSGPSPGTAGQVASFKIDLWGGSVILGHIKEAVLDVKVGEQMWEIPLGDVVEVVSPTPRISDATRQEIAAHIRELGNPEWEDREQASASLAEFGYLAKAMLQDALGFSQDPEVRRRIDKLLNEMP